MKKGDQFAALPGKHERKKHSNNDDKGDNKLGGGMISKRL